VSKVILVPKHAMGRVIGKGGKMIETLGVPHSCKLQFFRDKENERGETPLKITSIMGDCRVVEEVYEIVNSIVST